MRSKLQDESLPAPRPRRNFARWRALSLSLVYVLFAVHIIHWKIAGKTLAPLELNEVMYTLELGIVTAGFLFMCLLVLGTLVFGRFFCSWACHIMVLQDLCAWILRKLGIRRKPIRSRLLLLVPPLTAAYMFLWPQILRIRAEAAFPTFHLRTDAGGWASFATDNFWRNLPSVQITALTFLICGFVIVYLLGSRTFCTYVCPYGAVFALADRFSPGRIRVSDACEQCGTCTAACTSGIRVHEEVKQHGRIVNSACMKDLDCVSACPQGALSYGLARPALLASTRSGGRFGSMPYDFSLAEELLLAGVFVFSLFVFRGLYGRVPFLLALTLGAILGYLAVMALRLVTRPSLKVAGIAVKARGRVTWAGRGFAGALVILAAFTAHSAVVRYHVVSGLRHLGAFPGAAVGDERGELLQHAARHLGAADRRGLFRNPQVERGLLAVSFELERHDDVIDLASRLLERSPGDAHVRVRLGQALAGKNEPAKAEREFRAVIQRWSGDPAGVTPALVSAHEGLGDMLARRGDFDAAAEPLRAAVRMDPERATALAALGSVEAELGLLESAVTRLRRAVRLDPRMGRAHYNLGTILSHLGRFEEAIPSYEQALLTEPDDAALRNNLGYALMSTGRIDPALEQLERAVALDPSNADAHFNLGSLLRSQHETDRAGNHLRLAVQLEPRYGRLLDDRP